MVLKYVHTKRKETQENVPKYKENDDGHVLSNVELPGSKCGGRKQFLVLAPSDGAMLI